MKGFLLLILCSQALLLGCSPVRTLPSKQYQLAAFSQQRLYTQKAKASILVTNPVAVAGYQSEQMLYLVKPFELHAFAKNTWIDPPADMLFPLIVQSLEQSGYFHAVATTLNAELTDYRLDTQLLELQQNFTKKPSQIEFKAKVILTRIKDSKIIASRVFSQQQACSQDTPYGGVLAANFLSKNFTKDLSQFVLSSVKEPSF